jgi:hypothetical protein
MYKDAPHEGFERRKYLRSVVLGTAVGAGLAMVLPIQPARPAGAVLLFGSAYAVERALAELYKTFFRREDQSKYTIPMQLAIRGRVIESPAVRAAAGATYFTLLLQCSAGWPGGSTPTRAGRRPWRSWFSAPPVGGSRPWAGPGRTRRWRDSSSSSSFGAPPSPRSGPRSWRSSRPISP